MVGRTPDAGRLCAVGPLGQCLRIRLSLRRLPAMCSFLSLSTTAAALTGAHAPPRTEPPRPPPLTTLRQPVASGALSPFPSLARLTTGAYHAPLHLLSFMPLNANLSRRHKPHAPFLSRRGHEARRDRPIVIATWRQSVTDRPSASSTATSRPTTTYATQRLHTPTDSSFTPFLRDDRATCAASTSTTPTAASAPTIPAVTPRRAPRPYCCLVHSDDGTRRSDPFLGRGPSCSLRFCCPRGSDPDPSG